MGTRIVATTLLMLALGSAASAHNCTCTSTPSACSFDCTETDLRAALFVLNGCANQTVARGIEPNFAACTSCVAGSCSGVTECTMDVRLQDSTAACGDDPTNAKSLCITGDKIGFTGVKTFAGGTISVLTLRYKGHCSASPTTPCDSDGQCGASDRCLARCSQEESQPSLPTLPSLFRLQGSGDSLFGFRTRYFPRTIRVEGDHQSIEDVEFERICEDAISIEAGGGHRISGGTMSGNQTPDSGRSCYTANGTTAALCGIDKGIQVNDATTTSVDDPITITGVHFVTVKGPVKICEGCDAGSTTANSLVFSNNNVSGLASGCPTFPTSCTFHTGPMGTSCSNFCQGIEFDENIRTALVQDNTIDYCKWGVRVEGGRVRAEGNTFNNAYVAAFRLQDSITHPAAAGNGRLREAHNNIRASGCYTDSDCQRGAIALTDHSNAWVDAGGGDYLKHPVICDADSCANSNCTCGVDCPAGDCSDGGNVLCQEPYFDIWNNPIPTSLCNAGVASTGASVGFEANTVLSTSAPNVNIKEATNPTTRVSSVTLVSTCPF